MRAEACQDLQAASRCFFMAPGKGSHVAVMATNQDGPETLLRLQGVRNKLAGCEARHLLPFRLRLAISTPSDADQRHGNALKGVHIRMEFGFCGSLKFVAEPTLRHSCISPPPPSLAIRLVPEQRPPVSSPLGSAVLPDHTAKEWGDFKSCPSVAGCPAAPRGCPGTFLSMHLAKNAAPRAHGWGIRPV